MCGTFRQISQLWDNAHTLNLENCHLYLSSTIAQFFDFIRCMVFDFICYCVTTHTLYLVFGLCSLPQFCNFALFVICGVTTSVKVLATTSPTLLLLNSSLNPVIYCWKMRHIRRAAFKTLRHAFPSLRKASVRN